MGRGHFQTIVSLQSSWKNVLPQGKHQRLDPARPPLKAITPEERRRMRREDMKASSSEKYYQCMIEAVSLMRGRVLKLTRERMKALAETHELIHVDVLKKLRDVGFVGGAKKGMPTLKDPKPYTYEWKHAAKPIDAIHRHFGLE